MCVPEWTGIINDRDSLTDYLHLQEARVPIRLLLLKVFGVLCGLDRTVIGILLASVLPNELGRDIQQDMAGGCG